jgi:glycosyltransferase involved in cell wall biosynthesis
MRANRTITVASNTAWFLYNFHLALIKQLQAEGFRVVAVAPEDDYATRLEAEGVTFIPIHINSKGTNPLEELQLIRDFYRIYRRSEADLILNFTIKPNIYGSLAAGLLGIPVISTITGLGTIFLQDGVASKVGKILYRLALKIPKSIYYLNETDRALFVNARLVSPDKAMLIPGSGIDTDAFVPRQEERRDDTFRFLLIARLIKDKGIVEYVEAARKMREKGLKQVSFLLLGAYYEGNPSAVTPEEMARWEAEGVVMYLGTSDDVPSVISGVDCVVLPSYREGISQVLLEAASMEKPIITTDVPGCREVVDDGVNGYLCPAKDAGVLAERMQQMLTLSPEIRLAMGKAGREKVKRQFDESVVNRQYLTAIGEILRER